MAEEIKYRNLGAFSSAGGFNVANADPIDSRQLVADISHIFMDGNWAEVKPYPGLIVSAPSGEARIYVGREWSTANKHTDWQLEASWKKIGSGSVAVDTYGEAIAMATADTIGQVIYVKAKSTYNEVEYEAAPYIVIAAGSLQKLAASTAGGNIANDLAAVTTRVGTAEGKITILENTVGDSTKGLVADVAGIKTTIGDATSGLVADIAANTEAVAELRDAVRGGVHFAGVIASNNLPSLTAAGSEYGEDAYEGTWTTIHGDPASNIFRYGDIIILTKTGDSDNPAEPTTEYILAKEFDEPKWVELGDVSPADQKIVALEKEFDDHVAGVAEMLKPYALAANVVANETFNQHVTDAGLRMDGIDGRLNGIDEAILAVPVKSVTTGDVLKLSEAGALSVDMSGFVSTNGYIPYTQDEKTKLANIAAYAQTNVIEEVKVNGTALSVTDKSVNIDLSVYALSEDVVAKTTTINGQTLASDITLDATDIATTKVIGDMTTGTTVESAIETLYAKIGSVSTVANNALTKVVGSDAISVKNNNNISLIVKTGSALTVGTDGLDLVWETL